MLETAKETRETMTRGPTADRALFKMSKSAAAAAETRAITRKNLKALFLII
jgi:hypothetical protein